MTTKMTQTLLSLMVLLATTVGAAVLPTGDAAHAGSNGQQIFFSCGYDPYGSPQMVDAVVKGYNQYGQFVQWHGTVYGRSGYTYFATPGWWWVGNVRIYWMSARTRSWDSDVFYVPRQQNGDYSSFSCPRRLW